MHKNFFLIAFFATISVSIIILVKKYKTATKNFRLPDKTLTVPELRYYAYTSALAGRESTVRGICVAKDYNDARYFLYLNAPGKDSTVQPLKCRLSPAASAGFSILELNAEMVVSGKLQFSGGVAELEDTRVIIQNVMSADNYTAFPDK